MSQTAAPILGMGTKLYIATAQATPPTILSGVVTGGTLIAKVLKVSPPKPKYGTEDITTLDSPSNTRIFMKTLLDPGEVTVEGESASADPGQIALAAALTSAPVATVGQAWPFLLVMPVNTVGGQTVGGDSYAFNGLVTDFALGEAEPGKPVPFNATIKITGPITATEGS
jgi:hypothetical protein